MPLTIGDTFAGYRVLRQLGSGGMGEVYLVQHPRLPRQEALKVLCPDFSEDESFRERFIREADLASGLRHPHIVGVHDRGEHDGQLWIAMDYIHGIDLAHLMEKRYPAGMPIGLVVPVVNAVASALDYAHKKGLLHRDVKPANIIVADLDTDDPSIYLADFGIARPLDDTSGITATNMTVGTVAYAAPEQLLGEEVDGGADQYALAATTYQLLTGLQLFPHSNPAVVISRHLSSPPPSLTSSHADLRRLDPVLQVALAKEPSDRYAMCTAFTETLTDAALGQSAASPIADTRAAPRPPKSHSSPGSAALEQTPSAVIEVRRRWWAVLAAAAVAILLIGIGALAARTLQHSEQVATPTASSRTESPTASSAESSTPAATTSSVPPVPSAPSTVASTSPTAETQGRLATDAPSSTAAADVPPDEQGFLNAVFSLPNYVKGGGRATDAERLAMGYRACAALDQYPNDSQRATLVVYPGGNTIYGEITMEGDMFMLYSANYLCPRHAQLYENY